MRRKFSRWSLTYWFRFAVYWGRQFFWHLWDKIRTCWLIVQGKPVVYLRTDKDFRELLKKLHRWKRERK